MFLLKGPWETNLRKQENVEKDGEGWHKGNSRTRKPRWMCIHLKRKGKKKLKTGDSARNITYAIYVVIWYNFLQ